MFETGKSSEIRDELDELIDKHSSLKVSDKPFS